MRTHKKLITILSWMAVVIWMLFIFRLSSQPAELSDGLSRGVVKVIVETIEKVAPKAEFDINRLNHLLRKNAHFFTYLVLGVLVLNALRISRVAGIRSIALALCICVLYAVSDEVHQIFVPGRGAQVTDVLIDTAGAILGIGARHLTY